MAAGTLALILNFAFVFILIIGFLIGLWRGVKKASLNLGITLAGVLIGFFVSGPITKAVLGIKVAGGQTLSQYIVSLITQNADIKLLYDSTPSLQQTVAGLPYALVNPIMFLVVSIAIMLVTYLIYRIIACFIKKKDKEGNKIKQYRIAGGAVGLAKALVLTLFISMPLVSLIGTANDLINTPTSNYVSAAEADNKKDEGLLSSVVPKQVANIIDGLDTSAFGVLGNMFGLDNATFDYMSAFSVEGETIHIRKEVNNVVEVYGAYEVITDTFNADGEDKFEKINFDKIDKSIQALFSSKFYKTVISDAAFNLISNSQNYSFFDGLRGGQFGEIFNQISANISSYDGAKSDYFANDINNIYSAFKTLAKAGALDDAFSGGEGIVDKIKVIGLNYQSSLTQALENLFATNVFQTSAPAVINFAIDNLKLGIEAVKMEVEKVDWAETNKHLAENFSSLVNAYSKIDVDITEVLQSPESLLTKDSQVDDIVSLFANLGQMIDQINNMQVYYKPAPEEEPGVEPEPEEQQPEGKPLFVNKDDESIVDALLEKYQLTIPETLETEEKFKPENQERYKNFFTYLAEPLAKIKSLDIYDLVTSSDSPNPNDILKTLSGALAEDKNTQAEENTLEIILIRLNKIPTIKELVIDTLSTALEELGKSFIDFDMILNSTHWDGLEDGEAKWRTELGHIADLLIVLDKDAEDETYLDIALQEDGAKNLMTEISGKEGGLTITEVLKPVLSAESTANLKNSILGVFDEVLSTLLGEQITLDKEQATVAQADKICPVFEAFIDLYGEYQNGNNTLVQLWINAQEKVTNLEKALEQSGDGIFKDVYDKIESKLAQIKAIQSRS